MITGPSGATTTTAADGSYSFSNLNAGTYSVSAPATASGKARFTPSPLSVTIAAGATSANNNFGYVTGTISGFTYVDANRNSVKDAGEAGLGGVTVTLSGAASATTTTAADGSYSFTGLNSGSYSVSAPATAAGLARFTTSPLNITLAAGATSANNNFGYVTGTISGYTYFDANRNGVKDAGEAAVPNVPVTLAGVGTVTSNASGFYSFSGLSAATYSDSARDDGERSDAHHAEPAQRRARGRGDLGEQQLRVPQRRDRWEHRQRWILGQLERPGGHQVYERQTDGQELRDVAGDELPVSLRRQRGQQESDGQDEH